MKKLIITALMIVWSTGAWAHGHHHHHHYRHCYHHTIHARSVADGLGHGLAHMLHSMGGRPSAWCGWYMRQVKGVSDPAYNLARNWAHWGSPTTPHENVVVVWPHHVGEIVGRCGSGWLVHSGNDGHAVRTRCRSITGAIAFRE